MFVENFDEMYDKMTEIRQRNIEASLDDHNTPFMNNLYVPDFNLQAIILIQESINRLRKLGVPDSAMSFTVAELAVLSEMPTFDIKIRWTNHGVTLTT